MLFFYFFKSTYTIVTILNKNYKLIIIILLTCNFNKITKENNYDV